MTVVLDACVFVAALVQTEKRHEEARGVLDDLFAGKLRAIEPLPVLVEVCAALARRVGEPAARQAFRSLGDCESIVWEAVELEQAARAARLARECKLNSGDAFVAATAARRDLELLTYDRELLERTKDRIETHESWPP